MEDYHPRWLEPRINEALSDTRVVLLNGARQTGKSTLAEALAKARGGRYLTLDEPTRLAAATADPVAFIDTNHRFMVIDEVQRAPGLFSAIKQSVDRRKQPGRFLLTGSADIFLLPDISESLAGRMEVLSLQPLAQGELSHAEPDFIRRLLANDLPDRAQHFNQSELSARIVGGGFPEALSRKRADRRHAWFDAYVTTITQRDIRQLSNIEGLTELPRLLSLLAVRSGALANVAELARAVSIPQVTLHRYLTLLQTTFLYQPVSAWHANLGKRLIKAPKMYLLDSGLACVLGSTAAVALPDAPHYGGLLETFVLGELRRIAAGMATPPEIFHYRSTGGVEVDFVVEDDAANVIGVEVKANRSLGKRHFSGLHELEATLGKRFKCGVVLYGGEELVRFGPRLWAAPMSLLWG